MKNIKILSSGYVRRVLCFVVIMLACIKSYGYSLQNHQQITRDAVKLINLCIQKKHIKTLNPSEQLDVLIEYNLQQDQLWRKARLWHFPDNKQFPLEKSATSWMGNSLVISTSFNVWSDYLASQARNSIDHQDVYPAMGALLHYVQDVAVPAHAVPIFHPVRYLPPKADGFDSWDSFNSYSWLDDDTALKTICKQLSSHDKSVADIISHTLNSTLNNILQGWVQDNEQKNIWQNLYPVNGPKKYGFAQYGCGSEGEFGKPVVNCENQKFNVTKQEYVNFASGQRNIALQASAQVIYSLQRHLTPCYGQACVAKQGNDRWLPNVDILKKLIKE